MRADHGRLGPERERLGPGEDAVAVLGEQVGRVRAAGEGGGVELDVAVGGRGVLPEQGAAGAGQAVPVVDADPVLGVGGVGGPVEGEAVALDGAARRRAGQGAAGGHGCPVRRSGTGPSGGTGPGPSAAGDGGLGGSAHQQLAVQLWAGPIHPKTGDRDMNET